MNYNNNAQLDAEAHLTSVNHTPPDEQASSPADYPSPWNSNLQQPIIMQGHINNQQVTLFNRSAVELVTKLKQVHAKRLGLLVFEKSCFAYSFLANFSRTLTEIPWE